MENYQQNFLASLQGGLQLGQQLRGVQDRNQLNKLASQAYSAPPEQRDGLLGQMAGVDARAAQQQEQAFANTDERRNTTMVNMAKLLTSAPEQARAGLYQRMVPTLSGMGLSELPPEYNAQTAPIIDQAAQSIVQAYGGAAGGNVQSTYIDGQGNRVAIMRDGTQRMLGPNNASIRVMEQEGALPYGVVTSGGRPGQIVNLGGAPAAGGQAQPAGAYIDPALPPEVQQQIRQSLAAGQEPPSSMTFAQGPVRTPTSAEKAGGAELAKINAQNSNFENEIDQQRRLAEQQAQIDAQKAADVARSKGEAEAQLEAVQSLPRVMQESTNAMRLIDQALNHPGLTTSVGTAGRVDPRNYLPGTDATDFRVLLDQIKGGTFLQAFQSLKGGGAITEVEGTKAEQAIARLNRDQSEQAFRQSLQDLREVAQAAITRAQTKAQTAGGSGGASRSGAQRSVVRRGRTPDGRTVIQYSDGAIEYGN
jgi:hypothetical protein